MGHHAPEYYPDFIIRVGQHLPERQSDLEILQPGFGRDKWQFANLCTFQIWVVNLPGFYTLNEPVYIPGILIKWKIT